MDQGTSTGTYLRPTIPMPVFSTSLDDMMTMSAIGFWCIRHRLTFAVEWWPDSEDDPIPWYAIISEIDAVNPDIESEDWTGTTPIEVLCDLVHRWSMRLDVDMPAMVERYLAGELTLDASPPSDAGAGDPGRAG